MAGSISGAEDYYSKTSEVHPSFATSEGTPGC
jgi:hypothetical protein